MHICKSKVKKFQLKVYRHPKDGQHCYILIDTDNPVKKIYKYAPYNEAATFHYPQRPNLSKWDLRTKPVVVVKVYKGGGGGGFMYRFKIKGKKR
jgi:hypothetical protein